MLMARPSQQASESPVIQTGSQEGQMLSYIAYGNHHILTLLAQWATFTLLGHEWSDPMVRAAVCGGSQLRNETRNCNAEQSTALAPLRI